MLKRAEWTAAILLTVAVAGLHLLRLLHAGGLWRDEAAAVALATLPTVREVASSFQHEAFPLLFPLAVRGWAAAWGDRDLALRAFGAAVGLALAAALWWNARRLGRTLPLASLVLAGANPFVLVYGDSLRGYGLGSVLLLLTFGSFGRVAVRPDRRSATAAALLAIASVQCLLHAAALVLGLAAAALVIALRHRRSAAAVVIVGAGAAAALSLVPYLGAFVGARSWNVLVTFPLGPSDVITGFGQTLAAPLPSFLALWLLLLAVGITSAFAAARRAVSEEDSADLRLYAALGVALALVAQIAFLSLLRYAPRPWYFVPWLVLAASGLDLLLAPTATASRASAMRAARLAGAFLAAAVAIVPLWHLAQVRMTDMDLAARTVGERAGPGDFVLVNPWFYGVSFRRYYRGAAPWETVPALADHRFHRYDLFKARMRESDPLADVRATLAHTLSSGGEVFVVGGLYVPPPGHPPHWLPPAPGAPTGWLDVPYSEVWSEQIGAYLRDHAAGGEVIDVPAPRPVSGYEDVALLVVRGWRDLPSR